MTSSSKLDAAPSLICGFVGLQGGSPKLKSMSLNESDLSNTPGHPIELKVWHPTTTKTSKEETTLSIHQPRTQHMFRLPNVVDAVHNLHPLLDYVPPKLHADVGADAGPRTHVHHEDAAATPSLLEQAGFQNHPNHRAD